MEHVNRTLKNLLRREKVLRLEKKETNNKEMVIRLECIKIVCTTYVVLFISLEKCEGVI